MHAPARPALLVSVEYGERARIGRQHGRAPSGRQGSHAAARDAPARAGAGAPQAGARPGRGRTAVKRRKSPRRPQRNAPRNAMPAFRGWKPCRSCARAPASPGAPPPRSSPCMPAPASRRLRAGARHCPTHTLTLTLAFSEPGYCLHARAWLTGPARGRSRRRLKGPTAARRDNPALGAPGRRARACRYGCMNGAQRSSARARQTCASGSPPSMSANGRAPGSTASHLCAPPAR